MATWDERVDAAIDDAARRMTEGAPAPDFTARVMDRVAAESSQGRSRFAWKGRRRGPRSRARAVGWVLSPIAAASVVLIAVLLFRGLGDDHRTSEQAGAAGRSATTEGQDARAAADPKGSALRPGVQGSGREGTSEAPVNRGPDLARGGTPGVAEPGSPGNRMSPDRSEHREVIAGVGPAHGRKLTNAANRSELANAWPDLASGRRPGPFGPGDAARQLDASTDGPSPLDALAPPPLDIAPLAVAPLERASVPADDSIQLPLLDSIPPVTIAPLGGDDPQRRFQ
jgi:hypothetical protein